MITINKESCLDAPIKVDALNGVAFTKEQSAHKFIVSCYQNGEKLNLTGTITGKFICNGRTIEIALDYAGIDTDSNAWVILSQHCYDYAGRFQLAIFNTVGDVTFCIYACVGNVQTSQIGDPVDGGEIIDSVETLIQEIQTAVQSIPPTYAELVSRVDDLESIFDIVIEPTKNLWLYGDQTFVKNKSYDVEIPAGTYTLSAEITNSGDVTRSRFYCFYEGSGNTNAMIDANGDRQSATITFTNKVVRIRLDAATTNAASEGITSNWNNIQIESGSTATYYVLPMSAIDSEARKGNSDNANAIESLSTEVTDNLLVKGVINSVDYSSCDDVTKTGVYFLSNNSGIANFPYTSGWLMIVPSTEQTAVTYQYLQIAYAWNPGNYATAPVKYRVKASGTWTNWVVFYDRDAIGKIQTAIYQYNGYNILLDGGATSGTSHGITYTLNADNSWIINGVSDGSVSFRNLISSASSVPSYIYKGRKYRCNISQTTATLAVFVYANGTSTKTTLADNDILQIPDDMTGIVVRLEVAAGKTVTNETVFVSLVGLPDLEQNVTENTYNNNVYENTYNITATPTITADTNQYLASTGDTTDVSASIQTMLEQTGVCRLGPGDFYVSGIDMPSRTALLGCGQASRILLIGSNTTEGYAIRVGSECVLDGLNIWGSTSAGMTVSETIRERHGILFDGTADQQTPTTHYRVNVSNCWIKNFSGGGIVCKNTGYNSAACMNVSNVFIYYCNVGVYIPYFSEFHRFTNVHCGSCWYGCINNGGNNVFVNCNFSSNKLCFLMDNSDGNARNNSHGSVIGCVFDHANSNQGTGIKIVGCTNGEVFSGCQLFYADIEIENSKGIQFDNFNIGGGNCDIKITEGENAGLIIFNSCMFANGTYTLSGIVSPNNLVKLVNCWNTDGTAVVI